MYSTLKNKIVKHFQSLQYHIKTFFFYEDIIVLYTIINNVITYRLLLAVYSMTFVFDKNIKLTSNKLIENSTRSGVTRSTHFVALYLCLMCQSGLQAVLWSHIGIFLRLPRCRTSQYRRTFILSQYLSGKIWLTPYLMLWDWRVSRAGPMPCCWPCCSLLFCLQLVSLSLFFLYRLVVWGWGLRTDRVSISLSRPCIANLFK